MCYAVGSVQQATSTCPMCKVFKPSASRCPHIKEVCRNAANHPRDVIYLKNPEVQTFSGCGFCKWAKTSPPPARSGYQNPGWPGCCRPPNPNEYKLIGAADWPAVALVHHVPIPPEIKTILDSITNVPTSPRGTPPLGSPTGSIRGGVSIQTAAPGMARRSSHPVASPTRNDPSPRSNPVAIPTKSRSGGSPKELPASLVGSTRGGSMDGLPSSLPNASAMDQPQTSRRSAMEVFADKRPDPSNTTTPQCSPGQKHAELGGTISRRSSERRPSVSSISPPASVSKITAEGTAQRRRTAPVASTRSTERSVERAGEGLLRRGTTVEDVVEKVEKMSVSSASSSSSGSSSETTVISDGGFTDYLSDESEAELQRQAEAKAAILAQNQMEELEFRAARRQLAHVDLQPPKSWRGGDVQSTPRSQVRPNARNSTSYGQPPFAAGAPAYAAPTHSRG